MKIIRAVFGTIFFILLLISIYYIHIKCFKVNVVFYAAIADSFIAVTGAGLFLFIFEYFKLLTYFEKSQLIFIWLLIGYSTAITVPTVIDRSLSFYILEKIQQRGGGIKSDSFEHVFTQEYIKEYRLVDVRLTEQIESGTIIIENNCVKLTNKGETARCVFNVF